jgi:hypothetical protein
MTYDPNDPTRAPIGDPVLNRDYEGRRIPREEGSYLAPILLVAALILGGFFFYSYSGERHTTTASNNQAPITTNVPKQTPAPIPGPAPSVTPPATPANPQ